MIAFAMDSTGQIHYSVLDFNDPTRPYPQPDVSYWSTVDPAYTRPIPLAFPSEIRKAGQGSFGQATISQTLDHEGALDTFHSTTAQFTAVAPFYVHSDGASVFVFRKSNQPSSSRLVSGWKFGNGALLVDRYSLSGGSLLQKSEARYQRTRSRDFPASKKDCLSPQDMNGTAFYEPTVELGFVQDFDSFTVSLIPTAVAGNSYWQIFARGTNSGVIDAYGIEQADDGVFDFAGALSFACPNTAHPGLQPLPGTCVRCSKTLVQVAIATGADACVALGGPGGDGSVYATTASITLASGNGVAFSIEFWCRRSQNSMPDTFVTHGNLRLGVSAITAQGNCTFNCTVGGSTLTGTPLTADTSWHHYALVQSAGKRTLYVDGVRVAEDQSNYASATQPLSLGFNLFSISLDELRVWNIGLAIDEIQTGLQARRTGTEKALAHYYRLNEGSGTLLLDLAACPGGCNGQLLGTTNANSGWGASGMQLGSAASVQHNSFQADGFRHDRFTVQPAPGNLSALLYYQQESITSGYAGDPSKPQKTAAHLMLAFDAGGGAGGQIGILDFAVGYDGRLVAAPAVIVMPSLVLGGQSSVALARIFSDGHYLSLSGGLLDVASGGQAPVLLDSSTGDVRLYWGTNTHTTNARLSTLTYNTTALRPQYQIPNQTGLGFFATVAGDDLKDVVVAISAVSGTDPAATCTVTITHTPSTGIGSGTQWREIWSAIPADAVGLAAVLNGTSPLPEMATADSNWPGADLGSGSLWVSVNVIGASFTVQNGTTALSTTRPRCSAGFVAAPSSNAIAIDVPLQLANPPAAGAGVPATPSWDLTLETWVKPTSASGQVLIGQNVPAAGGIPASEYMLGLRAANNGVVAVASVTKSTVFGSAIVVQSQATTSIPLNSWSHVAAAFHQKAAVQFDGASAFADCGNDSGLDITGDLTLEVWLAIPQSHAPWPMGILGKGMLGDGIAPAATVATVPYSLYINDQGFLTFVYSRAGGQLCYAAGPQMPVGPCTIAVTRRCACSSVTGGALSTWDEITFYLNQVAHAGCPYKLDTTSASNRTIAGNDAALVLGRCVPALANRASVTAVVAPPSPPLVAKPFMGVISEVRLWGAALASGAIGVDLEVAASTAGLVSRWRFEERNGQQSADVGPTQRSTARLMNQCTWVQSPHPALSRWRLYLNGVAQQTATPVNFVPTLPKGTLSLGDYSIETGSAGQLAEVRIWATERTPRAIANSLYRALPRDSCGQVLEDGADLLAYYTLDSTSSANSYVFDRSKGGTNNLTLLQRPLVWNGQNSATVASGPLLTSSFTIEFWCKRTAIGHDDFIFGQNTTDRQTDKALHIGFVGSSNVMRFGFFSDDVDVSAPACTDLQWHHWAFVYDAGTRMKYIYGDGTLLNTPTTRGTYLGGSGAVTLGSVAPMYNNNKLIASVCELRVWGRALGRDPLVANMNQALTGAETGLLALWSMRNITGTTIPDLCGRHDATLALAVTPAATDPAGPVPGTLTLMPWPSRLYQATPGQTPLYWAGQNQALGPAIAIPASFTVEFWCQRISTGRADVIIVHNVTGTYVANASMHIVFLWQSNSIRFSFYGSDLDVPSTACSDGIWHHWAFVYNTANNQYTRTIYLDGNVLVQPTPCARYEGVASGGVALGGGGGLFGGARLNAFVRELRVWNGALAQSTIQANKNLTLAGNATGTTVLNTQASLAAAWPMTNVTGNQIPNLRGGSATLDRAVGSPVARVPLAISNAPLGLDIPEITNAVGGIATAAATDTANVSTPLGVAEYGVIEIDPAGNANAVLKRGFSLIQAGNWLLAGGYKVANLGLEWIGQAQFAPQIMGYIEGAPPVPGENLTDEGIDYSGASSVQFSCANEVTYSYDAQRDKGSDYSLDVQAMAGFGNVTTLITAPLGIGTSQQIADIHVDVGVKSSISGSTSQLSGASSSFSLSQNQLSEANLTGNWVSSDPGDDLGARWLPLNVGQAVVKSSTADLYALRLLSNNALVGYQMVPNLHIPPDWNIITFPINPFYIRQGCLDGRFRSQTDPFFPAAANPPADASYHRVAEAYALKSQIDREAQQLYADYLANDAVTEGCASWVDVDRVNANMAKYVPEGGNAPALSLGSTSSAHGNRGNTVQTASDPTQRVKRNLCNTYVWTAHGGLFSETQESLDGFTETHGGGYQFSAMAGLSLGINTTLGPADLTFTLDAMFGGHVNVTMTKSANATTGFGVDVSLDLPRTYVDSLTNRCALQSKPQSDPTSASNLASSLPIEPVAPAGYVDAYRFMTFYLAPTANNYTEFFNRVVHQNWLQCSDPNAVALRSAMQNTKSPPCWRVLHRVTFVSRVFSSVSSPPSPQSSLIKLDVGSHYLLIKQLEPYVRDKTGDWTTLLGAVESTLQTYFTADFPTLVTNPNDTTLATQIAQLMANYYGVPVG